MYNVDVADFSTLSLGMGHSLMLKNDGSVWAAGGNSYGQLGIDARFHTMMTNFVPVFFW